MYLHRFSGRGTIQSQYDLLSPAKNIQGRERSNSAGLSRLQVPHDTPHHNRSSARNDNSGLTSHTRSRSYSPIGKITRDKLPCGSPTFERVLCDMLSDTDLSKEQTGNDRSVETLCIKAPGASKGKYPQRGRRNSLSPHAKRSGRK